MDDLACLAFPMNAPERNREENRVRNRNNLDVRFAENPIQTAAANGQVYVVRQLLGQGANIVAWDNNGQTPIHLATANGQVDSVRELLNLGADIVARDHNGQTPIELARANNYNEVVDTFEDFEQERAAVEHLIRIPLHNRSEQLMALLNTI